MDPALGFGPGPKFDIEIRFDIRPTLWTWLWVLELCLGTYWFIFNLPLKIGHSPCTSTLDVGLDLTLVVDIGPTLSCRHGPWDLHLDLGSRLWTLFLSLKF